jgi:hypothetical protein
VGQLEQIRITDLAWSEIDDPGQRLIGIDDVAAQVSNRKTRRSVGEPFAKLSVICHDIKIKRTRFEAITEQRLLSRCAKVGHKPPERTILVGDGYKDFGVIHLWQRATRIVGPDIAG